MKHCHHYFFFLSKNLHIHLWWSHGNPLTCCFLFINPPAVHSNEPKGNISLLLSHHSAYNSQLWVSCLDFLILTFSRCSSEEKERKKPVQWRKVCIVIQSFAFCLETPALSTSDCYAVHISKFWLHAHFMTI